MSHVRLTQNKHKNSQVLEGEYLHGPDRFEPCPTCGHEPSECICDLLDLAEELSYETEEENDDL